MHSKSCKISVILLVTCSCAFGKLNDFYFNYNDYYDTNKIYYANDEPVCSLSAFPPHPESECCGVDVTSNDRIVGGSPTLVKQYPWLTLIEYKLKKYPKMIFPRCGGSLISGRYVLTAAHCVSGEILDDSVPYRVVLGDYNKYNEGPDCVTIDGQKDCTEGAIKILIQKTIVHDSYDTKSKRNDIALIRLKTIAPYTDAIRPICLPAENLPSFALKDLKLYLAGWGIMKQVFVEGEYKGTSSSVKRQLAVPYVPTKSCTPWLHLLGPNQLCAGGLKGQDSCMGDSGGPLMFENNGIYEISGVVSFGAGDPCGKVNVPGVYTNVFKYKDWITSHITV